MIYSFERILHICQNLIYLEDGKQNYFECLCKRSINAKLFIFNSKHARVSTINIHQLHGNLNIFTWLRTRYTTDTDRQTNFISTSQLYLFFNLFSPFECGLCGEWNYWVSAKVVFVFWRKRKIGKHKKLNTYTSQKYNHYVWPLDICLAVKIIARK